MVVSLWMDVFRTVEDVIVAHCVCASALSLASVPFKLFIAWMDGGLEVMHSFFLLKWE